MNIIKNLPNSIKIMIPYILMGLFFLLFVLQCEKNRNLKNQQENKVNYFQDEIESYENKYGQAVSEKKALKGNNEDLKVLIENKKDTLNELKKILDNFISVDFAGSVETKTKIDTVEYFYAKPINYEFSRKFEITDKHYFISGLSTNLKTRINTVKIPTTLYMGIGKVDTGFLKSEYRFEVTSSNPNVEIKDLNGGTFETYDSSLGMGFQLGYGYTPEGLQPYFGYGIDVDIIKLLKP